MNNFETVKSRIDIVAHIGKYVDLKQKGRIWEGLCPFHDDTKPSFQVCDFGDGEFKWICRSGDCGMGDIFDFERESGRYPDDVAAMVGLAKEYAIEITAPSKTAGLPNTVQAVRRAVTDHAAAQELSRFFAPEVAAKIKGADTSISAGTGEMREAAILNLDMRGFTSFAAEADPDEAMGLLAEQ